MNSASVPLPADATLSRPVAPVPPAADVATPPRTWPVAILGVPFDSVSGTDALARIEAMIASRQPHYVVTANVDFLVQAHRDVELRRILIDADLVLCDGTPLVWASRWLGNALPERVAGSDLTPALLRTAAERGHRVFFLGAGPGVAADAAARLQREYPSLKIVGHYAPPFAELLEMDHATVMQRIRASAPDILLVSFGCPKQEKWIAMHHRALGVPVCIGVGATLDFLAGRVKRAPAWMRRSGCEWLFRLLQEPRRLYRRYATDACGFLPALAAQWWRMAGRRAAIAPAPLAAQAASDSQLVDAGVELTRDALERHAAFWSRLPERSTHCVIDVSRVRRIDATGVAFLVKCRKALQQHSRRLVLVAPTPSVRTALETLRLADFFTFASNVTDARQLVTSTGHAPVLQDGTTRSLAWCGEIIAANVEDVWQMTSDYVRTFATGGATLVLIDLGRLRFIDSSGAGLMLRVKKWAQGLPAEIIFTHAQANVRNVLRLTRLDHLLLEGAQ